jgi:hypothetical protein
VIIATSSHDAQDAASILFAENAIWNQAAIAATRCLDPTARPASFGPSSAHEQLSKTLAVEALLDGEAETITRKAIELAKEGDLTALRLCLDRIAPPRKDRPVLFELPPIMSAADAVQASGALRSP